MQPNYLNFSVPLVQNVAKKKVFRGRCGHFKLNRKGVATVGVTC